jgi:hypothetical protein
MDRLSLVLGVAGELLLVAGIAKAARPRPTQAALEALGRPVPSAGVRAFGVGEVVLGVAAVLSGIDALAVAVGLVYLAFAAFVVVGIRRDLPSCGCFGTVGGAPSWTHFAVNLVLAIGSIGAGVAGARSLPDIASDEPLALVAVLFGTIGCYLLLNRGEAAVEPTAVGDAAEIADIDLRTGRTALVFLSTSCLTCREIFIAFASVTSGLPGGVRPVIVIKDDEPLAKVNELAPRGITTVQDSSAWVRYGVTVAPAVVLVDDGEVVTAGLAASWNDVLALSSP